MYMPADIHHVVHKMLWGNVTNLKNNLVSHETFMYIRHALDGYIGKQTGVFVKHTNGQDL